MTTEPSNDVLPPTARTRLHRLPKRGVFERATLNAILDEALVCHLGFVDGGRPVVIPTTYVRVGDVLYVHGSAASRALRVLGSGLPACITVTLLDGLVLARSAFHHSMNYRSVVVLGTALEVVGEDEKRAALDALVERVSPGRTRVVRGPNAKELLATSVLRMPIEEASAKVRTGPPIDDEEDLTIACWAGVIPLRLESGVPVADGELSAFAVPPALPGAFRR
jgi:uncharacterized protein